ncbi:hypothetical protein EYV94_22845 [Puteibacter caeruleilacunae]|nr:hypothetical protein EYV94_22845 [Puteibacter caeruleilacunae]
MKRNILIYFLFLFVVAGCASVKSSVSKIQHSTYVCNKGEMVGNTTIIFKDSTFLYAERGDLFQGGGKWKLLPGGKVIELKGAMQGGGRDLNLKEEININLQVKGKKKLVGDGCVFLKKNKIE